MNFIAHFLAACFAASSAIIADYTAFLVSIADVPFFAVTFFSGFGIELCTFLTNSFQNSKKSVDFFLIGSLSLSMK